jgi:predicted transcriptional regulator of viral defense system
MSNIKLPKPLKKGPFTYQQALDTGLRFHTVRQLVANEQCYTVAKGIYMPTSLEYTEENQFRAATLIVGEPSAVCLISALSFYHLTDQIPRKTWLAVPHAKRTQATNLKLFRLRDPLWNIGIIKHEGYSITSIERTIIDCLYYKRMIGTNTAIEALHLAVKKKVTTGSKILSLAGHMGVVPKLLPYLESISI